MIVTKMPLVIACLFLWTGFVCAISFMEAWLKFRAPGITIPIGLGIGRLVFSALNKVEWVFAIIIFINLIVKKELLKLPSIFLFIPMLIIIVQTWWLLPQLDARAQQYIEGTALPSSRLHYWFVLMEIIKVACLLIVGSLLFKVMKANIME